MAVVGAASSDESGVVALLGYQFRVPQLSYSSTSDELSDKSLYPFFGRLAPPDKGQAEALAQIVRRYGWGSNVSAISASNAYGIGGIERLHGF